MPELLLLSGGIDSTALAAWHKPAMCLTINYGQLAAAGEIRASAEICKALGLQHHVLDVPISSIGLGLLAGHPCSDISPNPEFWPFRNQFLITIAAMFATRNQINSIVIGTVKSDRRHADGGQAFILTMQDLLALQEGALSLTAPAIELSSVELVQISGIKLEILGWSHSCHVANLACGQCPGCNKHSITMRELGLTS